MDVSQLVFNIVTTKNKISSYKALLISTTAIYEEIQFKIYKMSMEISSGIYDITSGTQVDYGVSNEYIKKSILDGLKKKALALIEDQVILEFMINERETQLSELQEELVTMQNSGNQQ